MNVTEKQKGILLEYMQEHKDYARGRLRYSSENNKILDDMWFTVSNTLNAVANGPHKQPKEWQKTWRDWKSNVLKKCAKNRSYAGGTGGGPPKIINLTQFEENLLEIIDVESAGLENIPEGGNFQLVASNMIPEGGSFNRLSSAGTSKRTAEGHPKGLSAHSIKNKRMLTSVALNNQSLETENFSCEPSTFRIGSQSNKINDPYEFDFMVEEEESISILDENIEDDIVEREDSAQGQGTPVTSDVHRTPNRKSSNQNHQSGRTQSNARTAIDLMREKMELLREQVANNKQYQDRMIQIEEEKLQIARENMKTKKEIAGYLKNIHEEIRNELSNIDVNVTRLREDVEKIAPSYLE